MEMRLMKESCSNVISVKTLTDLKNKSTICILYVYNRGLAEGVELSSNFSLIVNFNGKLLF